MKSSNAMLLSPAQSTGNEARSVRRKGRRGPSFLTCRAALGPVGREFESHRPDQLNQAVSRFGAEQRLLTDSIVSNGLVLV